MTSVLAYSDVVTLIKFHEKEQINLKVAVFAYAQVDEKMMKNIIEIKFKKIQ